MMIVGVEEQEQLGGVEKPIWLNGLNMHFPIIGTNLINQWHLELSMFLQY